jgi:hypothetical protein
MRASRATAKMTRLKSLNKDRLGGLMFVILGAIVLAMGASYNIGTLQHMGAGFVPVAIGALMLLVGVAIALTATASGPAVAKAHVAEPVSTALAWRGWLCIIGGVAAFVLLGDHGGLVPASFASVFVAALGDRNNTWRSAAVLAAVATLFGVVVFYYGLHLPMSLFAWD